MKGHVSRCWGRTSLFWAVSLPLPDVSGFLLAHGPQGASRASLALSLGFTRRPCPSRLRDLGLALGSPV